MAYAMPATTIDAMMVTMIPRVESRPSNMTPPITKANMKANRAANSRDFIVFLSCCELVVVQEIPFTLSAQRRPSRRGDLDGR